MSRSRCTRRYARAHHLTATMRFIEFTISLCVVPHIPLFCHYSKKHNSEYTSVCA